MTPADIDRALRTLDPVDGDELARAWSHHPAAAQLRAQITATPRLVTRSSRRARRGVIAIALAAMVAATGWTSYQLLSASDTVDGFACRMPDGALAAIDLVSGDHARDCAAVWEHLGFDPPSMAAYQHQTSDGTQAIVVPADEDVPSTWTPLDAAAVDTSAIELEASFDDYVDGLLSSCHDTDQAVAFAEQELTRLGLGSWRVEVGEPGERGECAWAHVDGEHEATVTVRPNFEQDRDAMTGLYSWLAYAEALRGAIAETCLPLDEAQRVAQHLADEIDADRDAHEWLDAPLSQGLMVTAISDDDATCTTVDLNVYGSANLKLRGPAG